MENSPCFREESLQTYPINIFRDSLVKVDPHLSQFCHWYSHLGNLSSQTKPVVPHTNVSKYVEVPASGPQILHYYCACGCGTVLHMC